MIFDNINKYWYQIRKAMLHRVSRLHLSTLFSSTIRQGISSVPQVVPEKTLKNKVPEA